MIRFSLCLLYVFSSFNGVHSQNSTGQGAYKMCPGYFSCLNGCFTHISSYPNRTLQYGNLLLRISKSFSFKFNVDVQVLGGILLFLKISFNLKHVNVHSFGNICHKTKIFLWIGISHWLFCYPLYETLIKYFSFMVEFFHLPLNLVSLAYPFPFSIFLWSSVSICQIPTVMCYFETITDNNKHFDAIFMFHFITPEMTIYTIVID